MAEQRAQFSRKIIRKERKDGSVKERTVYVPSQETREQHRTILALLHSLGIPMPHATGAVPGKRLIDNVLPHRFNDSFYKMDLADAYRNVCIDGLMDVIRSSVVPRRFQNRLVGFVEEWGTAPGVPGLPQGAPASPFLFNLSCLPLDRRLGAFCGRNDIAYTRYLDDLTFSSRSPLGKVRRGYLRGIIAEHPGAIINHRKSAVHSLQRGPVTITGVSLYPDRRLGPSPGLYEKAREVFEDAIEFRGSSESLPEDMRGQVYGYHGALHQLSTAETPTLRHMDELYARALGKTGLPEAISMEAVQLALF